VEHVSPREVVSDLLTESQGWERRERTLTHLLLVDVVILRCLLPRHWLQAVYGHLTRATGWLRATGADGGGLVLPASHAGHRCAAAAGPARLPPTGQRPDHRRLCLWAAADGHRQDAGRCAGHPGQRGLLWPGGQWAQRQSLPFPSLPFPQARCLYLAAAGTHGLVNALFAPCRESPHRLFKGLLRSSSADMLVLLERGLFSGAIFEALRARGARARARLEPACSPSRCACCRTAVTWCS